jgi:hypothetical protein
MDHVPDSLRGHQSPADQVRRQDGTHHECPLLWVSRLQRLPACRRPLHQEEPLSMTSPLVEL